ncbi:uncharacterized protein LOC114378690 [Glycine soja]|uniref:uncharacterized protein LOC114378690 n=1 Tax=Glycine soja TaxID=3848 RepID=UPI00103BE153|nr:uncharacterized protein LOC114378690 [Glycine soja]
MASNFLTDIGTNTIQRNRKHEWVWKEYQSGKFTMQSAYKLLTREAVEGERDRAFEELWNLKVLSKVAVFAWRLLRDRLPTKVNLYRRQVEVADTSCPFCGNMEEDAGHLFFHCSKILPLWWETLSWLNISVALPIDPKQHFLQHGSIMVGGTRINRWKCWWLAVTWTIWQKRNKIIFNNESLDKNKLIDDTSFLLWTWLSNLEKGFAEHFNQWSTNIRQGFLY